MEKTDEIEPAIDAERVIRGGCGMKEEAGLLSGVKPDLVLNMKREWFVRVWNGEKTVEYREVKPHWMVRIGHWVGKTPLVKFVEMRIGYLKDGPVLLLQVYRVDIGKCPHECWDGEYFRLHFGLVGRDWRQKDGVYVPFVGSERKLKGAVS